MISGKKMTERVRERERDPQPPHPHLLALISTLLHQMPLTHQPQMILIQLQTMTTTTEIDQK
jgi:hypothetical protein